MGLYSLVSREYKASEEWQDRLKSKLEDLRSDDSVLDAICSGDAKLMKSVDYVAKKFSGFKKFKNNVDVDEKCNVLASYLAETLEIDPKYVLTGKRCLNKKDYKKNQAKAGAKGAFWTTMLTFCYASGPLAVATIPIAAAIGAANWYIGSPEKVIRDSRKRLVEEMRRKAGELDTMISETYREKVKERESFGTDLGDVMSE